MEGLLPPAEQEKVRKVVAVDQATGRRAGYAEKAIDVTLSADEINFIKQQLATLELV